MSKNVLIEVSTGYERTGIYVEEYQKIAKILEKLLASPNRLTFKGLYNHCGHTYLGEKERDETKRTKIEAMNRETVSKLVELRDYLERQFESSAPIFIG